MFKLALTSRYHNHLFFIKENYIRWLEKSFLLEIVLPSSLSYYEDIAHQCDALLLLGGDDIHPSLYDQTLHYYTNLENQNIEKMDFSLISAFLKEKKPIIGICRGIQLLNVFFNGTLIQHITDYKTVINHEKQIHKIVINHDSFFAKYFPLTLYVNSYHHQCIKQIGHTLSIAAISEDGFIEAIESDSILAVQWHPEIMDEKHKETFIQLMNDFINQSHH